MSPPGGAGPDPGPARQDQSRRRRPARSSRGEPRSTSSTTCPSTSATGELLGLVGESGSGKTTVALALLGYARRGLEVAGGQSARSGASDMVRASRRHLQRLRGAEVAYVPQDPTSALNPALRIGTQLAEVLRAHPTATSAAKDLGEPAVKSGGDARGGRPRREVPGLLKVLPPPAVGRAAAAGGTGDGLRPAPERDRLRRADDRPRRHDTAPCARHRAAPLPQLTAWPPSTSRTTSPSSAGSSTA